MVPGFSKRSSRGAAAAAKPQSSAYERAIRLLARRAHSRLELKRKLLRTHDAAAVEGALERVAGAGYLDDGAFAASVVRRRGSDRGPRAIAAELAAKGIA